MEEKMTYYDWLFRDSDEEKEINRQLDEERTRFENTEVYKEHHAKVDELFERLKVAGEKRREEAKKHKPKRVKAKYLSEEEMAELREKNRKGTMRRFRTRQRRFSIRRPIFTNQIMTTTRTQ